MIKTIFNLQSKLSNEKLIRTAQTAQLTVETLLEILNKRDYEEIKEIKGKNNKFNEDDVKVWNVLINLCEWAKNPKFIVENPEYKTMKNKKPAEINHDFINQYTRDNFSILVTMIKSNNNNKFKILTPLTKLFSLLLDEKYCNIHKTFKDSDEKPNYKNSLQKINEFITGNKSKDFELDADSLKKMQSLFQTIFAQFTQEIASEATKNKNTKFASFILNNKGLLNPQAIMKGQSGINAVNAPLSLQEKASEVALNAGYMSNKTAGEIVNFIKQSVLSFTGQTSDADERNHINEMVGAPTPTKTDDTNENTEPPKKEEQNQSQGSFLHPTAITFIALVMYYMSYNLYKTR